MRDPGVPRRSHEPRHRRERRLRVRDRQLPVGVHEVDLRVDVPEHTPHVTSSRRGFGLSHRPTFAEGLPSLRTMSAVKSFEPRISDEPTP